MKKLLFLLALPLLGQNTPVFPGAVATNNDLLIAPFRFQTTLTSGIGSGDVTLNVVSTTGIPILGAGKAIVVVIDSEEIRINAITATTMAVENRGFDGTVAASHASGAAIFGYLTPWHHNQLAAEVTAIETNLGITNCNDLQTAINALSSGGMVRASGTIICPTLTIPNGPPITIQGTGVDSTIIKLANNANTDLLTNVNFSSLSGTQSAPAGVFRLTLKDLTLDGNKANQSLSPITVNSVTKANPTIINVTGSLPTGTSITISGGTGDWTRVNTSWVVTNTGANTFTIALDSSTFGGVFGGVIQRGSSWPIRLYQHGPNWVNIVWQNGYSGGAYSEYATNPSLPPPTTTDLEANIVNVRALDNNGDGLFWAGPHDSYITNFESDGNTGWGIHNVTSLMITNMDLYNNFSAGLIEGPFTCTNCVLSNATGVGCEIKFQTVILVGGKCAAPVGMHARFNLHSITGTQLSSVGVNGTALIFDGLQSSHMDINIQTDGSAGSKGIQIINGDGGMNSMLGTVPPATANFTPITGTQSLNSTWFMQGIPIVVPTVETWHRYTLLKTGGNWTINGLNPVAAAAATSQTITVAIQNFPYVSNAMIKTAVAFTGTTTATAVLGSTGVTNFYISIPYDLMAAVSSTNIAPTNGILNGYGLAGGYATLSLALTITTTGGNVSNITDGASVDVWMKFGLLP